MSKGSGGRVTPSVALSKEWPKDKPLKIQVTRGDGSRKKFTTVASNSNKKTEIYIKTHEAEETISIAKYTILALTKAGYDTRAGVIKDLLYKKSKYVFTEEENAVKIFVSADVTFEK